MGQVPALVQHFFDISVALLERGYATMQGPGEMLSSDRKNRLHEENLMRLCFLAVGLTLGLECWTNAGTPPIIESDELGLPK